MCVCSILLIVFIALSSELIMEVGDFAWGQRLYLPKERAIIGAGVKVGKQIIGAEEEKPKG